MAATLSLDTLTSAGSGITVATGKTLTVGGKSVTAGSSNIQRATGDVEVADTAGYGVAGKSELIIAANAGAATRTITLCPVTETGVDTCIITVVADVDAGSGFKLTVVENDGTTEVWTGYQTGDFVRLIVSNGAWLVVDHKETYYSYRYLTANQAITHSTSAKFTGWTNVTEIGDTWDNTNDKLVTPTGMNGYWTINFSASSAIDYFSGVPVLYLGGVVLSNWASYGYGGGGHAQGQCGVSGEYYATSTQAIEFYGANVMNGTGYGATGTFAGSSKDETHFTARFNRIY